MCIITSKSDLIMAKCWNILKSLAVSLTMGLALVTMVGNIAIGSAMAQEEESSSGSATLSTAVARVVGDAYNDLQSDNYVAGIAKLENLLAQRGGSMSPFEKGTVYELIAGAKAQLDPPDYRGALAAFQKALDTGGLPIERTRQIRFNMAQLYFAEERYQEAINFLQDYIRWAEANAQPVSANTYYILAAAYYQLDRYREARRPMERAVSKLESPKKGYYELLNAIYANIGESTATVRASLLVKMINFWPDSSAYWSQLAQVYQSDGKDKEAAAVLESAYRAGLITEKNQIRTLIQYYNFLDTPYRGAKLLEKEMAAGKFERTIPNLELLAQLWSQSREHKKAIKILRELAQKSPNGKYYYRLGQSLLADEQWAESIKMLRSGISKGLDAKKTGDSWLLIGTALYSINSDDVDQLKKARDAFRNAAKYSASRKRANEWINYIDNVIKTIIAIQEQERQIARQAAEKALERCRELVRTAELGGAIDSTRLSECREMLREADTQ